LFSGLGVGLILTGLAFRSFMAFLAVYCTPSFNKKEKIFMTIAWVPKATVQVKILAKRKLVIFSETRD